MCSVATSTMISRQLVWRVENLRFPIHRTPLSWAGIRSGRQVRLQQLLSCLAPGWNRLNERLRQYVADFPQEPEDPRVDALECLQWLRRNGAPTALQLDYWLCQQAVCLLTQRKEAARRRYRQFSAQRRLSRSGGTSGPCAWRLLDSPWILVNPLRHWVSLATPALLDGVTRPPANVLFYVADREIRAAAFGLEGLALFNSLVDHEPCLLGDWAIEVTLTGVELLQDFCVDLADLGLVAARPPLVGV